MLVRKDTSQHAAPGFDLPAFALFALIFSAIWLLHAPLLRLPYFWDEAGYYIPAARDLWLNHQLIPSSTVSSGHPPLVMAWLAFWWKFSSFSPAMTRTAMLMVAAFGLLGVYRLAKQVANVPVAIASTALTAIYPVWFAQSSLAHLDVAAAAFTFWGLSSYLRDHRWRAIVFFALGGLAKETAIIAPLVLCAWELVERLTSKWGVLSLAKRSLRLSQEVPNRLDAGVPHPSSSGRSANRSAFTSLPFSRPTLTRSLVLLISVLPLAAWFVYHYSRTGVFFGNPEFFRYNVAATVHPFRILLALIQRFWHAFGYLNLLVLTIAAGMAMLYAPISHEREERKRIAIPVQMIFAVLTSAYIVMLAVLGGAVIARYMLPVVPLVIIVAVSTLRRRVSWWHWACGVVGLTFVLALFVNPPYRISPEDNLTYASYVRLHKDAASVIEKRFPNARVLTAWPASDELTRPWLRYVSKPVKVVRIDNFSLGNIQLAAQEASQYDIAYLFSTKLEPALPMFGGPFWTNLQERFFDYHRDLPPEAAASLLGGRIIYHASRNGEWVAIVQIERIENASIGPSGDWANEP